MNVDTIKQQLTRARGAYTMGTVDRETLDDALNIIEKEVADGQGKDENVAKQLVRPFGNTQTPQPAPAASNTLSAPQPSTDAVRPGGPSPASGGQATVPEQVGKPFKPGGDVQRPQPNQTTRNRP